MNDPIDQTNPAVTKHLHVPPKLLEDVAADPAMYEPVVRSMAVVHMDHLYRNMMRPEVPLATRIDFQRLLNKMSRLEPEAKVATTAGSGFSITINIPTTGTNAGTTIESHAEVVDDSPLLIAVGGADA